MTAIDLDDTNLLQRWVPTAQRLGLSNYHAEFQDARHLNFPDASFDYVYSISVIEHIPENGDSEALREFRRVLKPGGLAVVEVPFRRAHEDVYQSYDSKGAPLEHPRFYERYYDLATLTQRLTVPGLTVEYKRILGEWMPIDPWIAMPRLPRLLRVALLPLEPLLAILNMWVREANGAGRPLGATLVYRKAELSCGNSNTAVV